MPAHEPSATLSGPAVDGTGGDHPRSLLRYGRLTTQVRAAQALLASAQKASG